MDKRPPLAKKYFLEQQKLCCRYLRAYGLRRSAENLHQLRVSIKKIRALLKMLNKLDSNFEYRKNFSPYRNIFRKAGAIREESLHVEKLNEDKRHQPKPSVQKNIDKLKEGLVKSIPASLMGISKVQDTIVNCFGKVDRKEILPYCARLFRHFESNWKKMQTEEDLHTFRKRLKHFIYCSQLLTEAEMGELASEKKFRNLDELQDIIGKWHDNVLLLNKVSKENLEVDSDFLFALKHQTHHLLMKAHKKGKKL